MSRLPNRRIAFAIHRTMSRNSSIRHGVASALLCITVLLAFAIIFLGNLRAQTPQKLEVEIVTLRDGGFYPNKITRPAGTFMLLVLNRSHANQIQLGINSSEGTVIAAVEQMTDVTKSYVFPFPADTY